MYVKLAAVPRGVIVATLWLALWIFKVVLSEDCCTSMILVIAFVYLLRAYRLQDDLGLLLFAVEKIYSIILLHFYCISTIIWLITFSRCFCRREISLLLILDYIISTGLGVGSLDECRIREIICILYFQKKLSIISHIIPIPIYSIALSIWKCQIVRVTIADIAGIGGDVAAMLSNCSF